MFESGGLKEDIGAVLPTDFRGEVASFTRDRRILVVANYRGDSVDVFEDSQLKHRLPHPRVCCVALHPNGAYVVSTSIDGAELRESGRSHSIFDLGLYPFLYVGVALHSRDRRLDPVRFRAPVQGSKEYSALS